MSRPVKWLLRILVAFVVSFLLLCIVGWLSVRNPLRFAKTQALLSSYPMVASNYFKIYGRWPQSIAEITTNPSNIVFIAPCPPTNDAWGRPIIFEPFDPARGYGRVMSYGRDAKPGGTGPDADIEFRFGK